MNNTKPAVMGRGREDETEETMDKSKFKTLSRPRQVKNRMPEQYFEFYRGGRFFYADRRGNLNSNPDKWLLDDGHINEVFVGRELAEIEHEILKYFYPKTAAARSKVQR